MFFEVVANVGIIFIVDEQSMFPLVKTRNIPILQLSIILSDLMRYEVQKLNNKVLARY